MSNLSASLDAVVRYTARVWMRHDSGPWGIVAFRAGGDIFVAPNEQRRLPVVLDLFRPELGSTDEYMVDAEVVTSGGVTALPGRSVAYVELASAAKIEAAVTPGDTREVLAHSTISQDGRHSHTLATESASAFVQVVLAWPRGDLDLHLYDSSGRHVGVNYTTGGIEVEIPGASYSGAVAQPEVIRAPVGPGESLRLEVLGVEAMGDVPYAVHVLREVAHPADVRFGFDVLRMSSVDGLTATGNTTIMEVGLQEGSSIVMSASDLVSATATIPASAVTLMPSTTFLQPGGRIRVESEVTPGGRPYGTYLGTLTATHVTGTIVSELRLDVGCDLSDFDNDGDGDACDSDDDNDGLQDVQDCAPLNEEVDGPPGEPSDLVLSGGAVTDLSWIHGSQASAFNVYRGIVDGVIRSGWTCLAEALREPRHSDGAIPAEGAVFTYLITSVNECQESGAGSDSAGTPRVVLPCR